MARGRPAQLRSGEQGGAYVLGIDRHPLSFAFALQRFDIAGAIGVRGPDVKILKVGPVRRPEPEILVNPALPGAFDPVAFPDASTMIWFLAVRPRTRRTCETSIDLEAKRDSS
jgi:hypothetical protein